MSRAACFVLAVVFSASSAPAASPTVGAVVDTVWNSLAKSKATLQDKSLPPLKSVTMNLTTKTEASASGSIEVYVATIGGTSKSSQTQKQTIVLSFEPYVIPIPSDQINKAKKDIRVSDLIAQIVITTLGKLKSLNANVLPVNKSQAMPEPASLPNPSSLPLPSPPRNRATAKPRLNLRRYQSPSHSVAENLHPTPRNSFSSSARRPKNRRAINRETTRTNSLSRQTLAQDLRRQLACRLCLALAGSYAFGPSLRRGDGTFPEAKNMSSTVAVRTANSSVDIKTRVERACESAPRPWRSKGDTCVRPRVGLSPNNGSPPH